MDRMGYQTLNSDQNQNEFTEDDNPTSNDHNLLEVHVVPDHNKTRWNHIEDLDAFFTRVYYYHHKHGFTCLLTEAVCELGQFAFIITFFTYIFRCIDYPILFHYEHVNGTDPSAKVKLPDVLMWPTECAATFGPIMWTLLTLTLCFWVFRLAGVIYNTIQNLEIRAFYKTALGIDEAELDNLKWCDVQKRIRAVQHDYQMCIHKQDLTELDIHHRILRFKNYFVAMTNKNLLPLRINIPFVGEKILLTSGLKFNYELILFHGPWAPFESSWHLREDYKKISKRMELAENLKKRITLFAAVNLFAFPLTFVIYFLYSFCNYAWMVKSDPGILGMRNYTLYGRLFFRHFNELDHELQARLSRAFKPAVRYMSIFNPPVMTIVSKTVVFVAGTILTVLVCLASYDEDVVAVEHVLAIMVGLGFIVTVAKSLIPDEQLVSNPEPLLTAIVANLHYFPDPQWKGRAHTSYVRDEFGQLFDYRANTLLINLLSPLITPYVLYFHLRHKALDIVDFYRNFTVEVVGVGDVCSFAQMDVRKHGNPAWRVSTYDMDSSDMPKADSYIAAENGKTELSLVHFTHTNPEWKPPNDSETYMINLRERAAKDMANLPALVEENPLRTSVMMISSMGNEYSSLVSSLIGENQLLNQFHTNMMNASRYPSDPIIRSPQATHVQPTFESQQTNQYNGDHHPLLDQSFTNQGNPMDNSFRHRNVHEGNHLRPGIITGMMQSRQFDPQMMTSCNMLSFANSFAHYPNTRVSQRLDHGNPDIDTVNMSIDMLYLHAVNNMEIRRRDRDRSHVDVARNRSSSSSMPHYQNNNQRSFQLRESQPQLHANIANQNQQNTNSSSTSEKTPLLSSTNAHRS